MKFTNDLKNNHINVIAYICFDQCNLLRDLCFPYKLIKLCVSDGELNGKQRGST